MDEALIHASVRQTEEFVAYMTKANEIKKEIKNKENEKQNKKGKRENSTRKLDEETKRYRTKFLHHFKAFSCILYTY